MTKQSLATSIPALSDCDGLQPACRSSLYHLGTLPRLMLVSASSQPLSLNRLEVANDC